MSDIDQKRRRLMQGAAFGLTAAQLGSLGLANAASVEPATPSVLPRLNASKTVRAGVLNVAYHEVGPANGPVVLLLHGFPYDIHSYIDVAPLLAAQGCRVIVPYLRGHGGTTFIDATTPRAGQQAAIGVDVIALMDALHIERAVLAGYDWGGRAACVAAALWPQRCIGLVSVNSYLIQDIAKAGMPLPPGVESGLWYQYYFQTERGRAGLIANRREIARTIWTRNSPNWHFTDAILARATAAFDNADYVDIVIHSYRHRLGLAPGFPQYEEIERKLAAQPVITVPAITIDGAADGVVPATDGKSSAAKFGGPRLHRVVAGAGHNLPEEAPQEFTAAVMHLVQTYA